MPACTQGAEQSRSAPARLGGGGWTSLLAPAASDPKHPSTNAVRERFLFFVVGIDRREDSRPQTLCAKFGIAAGLTLGVDAQVNDRMEYELPEALLCSRKLRVQVATRTHATGAGGDNGIDHDKN
jgi:hypothetical protein